MDLYTLLIFTKRVFRTIKIAVRALSCCICPIHYCITFWLISSEKIFLITQKTLASLMMNEDLQVVILTWKFKTKDVITNSRISASTNFEITGRNVELLHTFLISASII